jgi:hypothetical protein
LNERPAHSSIVSNTRRMLGMASGMPIIQFQVKTQNPHALSQDDGTAASGEWQGNLKSAATVLANSICPAVKNE